MAILAYNEKHDAYYNPYTMEWAEDVCINPDCEYCKDRPEKAFKDSDIKWNKDEK